jgi:hypothetical protein
MSSYFTSSMERVPPDIKYAECVINMYPTGPIAPMDDDKVPPSIAELLKCSEISPFDLKKISGFLLSDNDLDVQRGALELLGDAAESEKENFTETMSVTFGPVARLLSSPDCNVHWGALHVLKFFFLFGYQAEAAKSVVHILLLHIQSPESDMQLASVEVLDAAAQSEAIEVVAPTLPALVGLLSSLCTNVRDAALRVLVISARKPKLRNAFRSALDVMNSQDFLLLLSTNHAGIKIALLDALDDRTRHDDTLFEAVVGPLSSGDTAIQIPAQKVLNAIKSNKAVTATSPVLVEPLSPDETPTSVFPSALLFLMILILTQ